MQRQTIETLLGAAVLLIGIGFITIAFSSSGVSTSQGYRLIAEFDDASGVQTGTEVRMSGIRVGQVTGKRLDQEFYLAVVTMELDPNLALPSDSFACILPNGLLGTSMVWIDPGEESASIESGGRIERTRGASNVVDVIGRSIFVGDGSSDVDVSEAPSGGRTRVCEGT